jgi:hypothetical protein
MPIAPGWGIKQRSISATGTTSLSITKPNTTVDGDIMIMCLSHKGTSYATMPAGWTLVAQNISSAIRGEMYWRRASGEGASYSITGLATAAQGHIVTFTGGLTSGDIVVSAVSQANATAPANIAPAVTTTLPHQLIFGMVAAGSANNFGNIFQPYQFPAVQVYADISINHLAQNTGGNATAASLTSGCVTKAVPGTTDVWKCTVTGDNVGIIAVFQQDITSTSSGTRYYLSTRGLPTFIYGPLHGEWDGNADGPGGYSNWHRPFELSQFKSDGGIIQAYQISTNKDTVNELQFRYFTPPLAAQTIDGTFNLCVAVGIVRNDTSTGNPIPTGYFRVHMYVSVGDSCTIRGTLLDKYTDTKPWNPITLTFSDLIGAQTLNSVVCQAGDRVCIELGYHATNATSFPAPVFPPNKWNVARMHYGCSNYRGLAIAGNGVLDINSPGCADATAGDAEQNDGFPRLSYFDFSHTFVEQTVTITPLPNNTFATAQDIGTLPFDSGFLDNRTTDQGTRSLWYKWTAERDGQVIPHTIGSVQPTNIHVWTGNGGPGVTLLDGTTHTPITSCSNSIFNAVAGTTYYFYVEGYSDIYHSPSAGGMVRFQVLYAQDLADGDVILGSASFVARYTKDGVLAAITSGFGGLAVSGLAIDYTLRPMTDFNGPPDHTGLRLYCAIFGQGYDFIEIVDLATLNIGTAEIDFMSDPLGSHFGTYPFFHNVHLAAIDIARDTGMLTAGWFGDGFKHVDDNLFSYQDTVALNGTGDLNTIDCIHADDQPGAPFPEATIGTTAMDPATGTIFYYTSGGWYLPNGGVKIKAYDVAGNTQLPDFATVPVGTGPNPGLKGVFPLPITATTPNGGMLYTNGSNIYRTDLAGNIVTTYTTNAPDRSLSLADVELQDDGRFFWVLDQDSTSLFKFDMQTGAQVVDVWTQLGYASCTSIVLYRANPFAPPNPPNPIISTIPRWELHRFDAKPRDEERA